MSTFSRITLIFSIIMKNLFFWIIEVKRDIYWIIKNIRYHEIWRQSFLEAGCIVTRSTPPALHFVLGSTLLAISALLHPKLLFGPEKLIN